MDSQAQLVRPAGQTYDEYPPNAGVQSGMEGEDDHRHQGKPSVLKKVKAKAKKLKKTLTKSHGHDQQEHDHDHVPDDHDLDEEDDDDEEMEDPEVHGAPIYESAPIREEPSGPKREMGEVYHDPSTKSGKEENSGVDLKAPISLKEDPHAPKDKSDSHVPGNYESKVTDPSGQGGEEAGITPLVQSFGKMSVDGEPESKSSGSHDHFSPSPPPGESNETVPKQSGYADKISSATSVITGRAISAKNMVASKLGYGAKDSTITEKTTAEPEPEMPISEPGTDSPTDKPLNQTSYTDKISSATSVITDRAISAKNVVAQKLGYGEKENSETGQEFQGGEEMPRSPPAPEQGKKFTETVTEKLSPVYGKVAGAGTAVMSKVPAIGGGAKTEGQDKGVSVKDYLSEKLRPGEEDKALSEVITETLYKKKGEDETEKETETETEKKEFSDKPMGKVTESEEVAKRLGSGDETVGSPGMVSKVKGTVSSWFGKGGEEQGSPVADKGGAAAEDRRLQESGN